MARASRRPKLVLTGEEKTHLDQLRQSRTAALRDVQRARKPDRARPKDDAQERSEVA